MTLLTKATWGEKPTGRGEMHLAWCQPLTHAKTNNCYVTITIWTLAISFTQFLVCLTFWLHKICFLFDLQLLVHAAKKRKQKTKTGGHLGHIHVFHSDIPVLMQLSIYFPYPFQNWNLSDNLKLVFLRHFKLCTCNITQVLLRHMCDRISSAPLPKFSPTASYQIWELLTPAFFCTLTLHAFSFPRAQALSILHPIRPQLNFFVLLLTFPVLLLSASFGFQQDMMESSPPVSNVSD